MAYGLPEGSIVIGRPILIEPEGRRNSAVLDEQIAEIGLLNELGDIVVADAARVDVDGINLPFEEGHHHGFLVLEHADVDLLD